MLNDTAQALVVDPGDALPVLSALQGQGLTLAAILVTHHHPDHTGGVATLAQTTGASIFRPHLEAAALGGQAVREGDQFNLLGLDIHVMDVPGHTLGHVAYVLPAQPGRLEHPVLFCGDTLFSGGCGRVFEGTPAQMLGSLRRLAALPDDTRVCCAHEYTLSNLRFGLAVEPHNQALHTHQSWCNTERALGRPTLPSTLGLEHQINPYLRVDRPEVRAAVPAGQDDVQVFAALRAWKNQFA